MTCFLMLILLPVGIGDPQKGDTEADRARRANIVDRIMGEPLPPHFRINQTLTTEMIEVSVELPGVDDEDDNPAKMPPRLVDFVAILERENFDRWVFGNMKTEPSRRAWLEYQLGARCEQVLRTRTLSRSQVEKLRLAGRGDIKRFFDRVEEMRPGFDAVRSNMEAGRRYLASDMKPVCAQFQAGPFGDGSLFAKMLKKIENETQALRLEIK